MNFNQIVSYIATKSSQTLGQDVGNNTKIEDLIKTIFNLRQKDFNNRYAWPWREKTDVLQTISNYETGTVEVTNNSRIVTGTNTIWTAAMEGRYLKLTRDEELYEILTVSSAASITLRQTYIGASSSGLSYLIWSRYYNLAPDVPFNNDIIMWKYPYRAKSIPKNDLHRSFLQPYSNGFPEAWTFGKVNRLNTRYNTGTVSVLVDSKTLTGVSTSWLANIQSGSLITILNDKYNVESVDSDTHITMMQNALNAADNSAYTIDTNRRQTIVLSSTPNPQVNLNLTYYKRAYDLINDNDELDIWDEFLYIPIIASYSELLDKLTSDRAFNWLMIYEKMVKEAWRIITDNDTPEEATRYMGRYLQNYRASLYG